MPPFKCLLNLSLSTYPPPQPLYYHPPTLLRYNYTAILLADVVLIELIKGATSSLLLNKFYSCLN
jgi:hypothetical protein